MKVSSTPLEGLKIVELTRFGDARGFFMERFSAPKFLEAGLPGEFQQDNHSRSAPGVLRGLHYQFAPAQGKLVGAITGRIWDVAVDIRPESPTYGKHFGLELSEENSTLLWIPAGFAHGFCVLGEQPADVLYKVTVPYNPKGERGIAWDDTEFGVAWPLHLMSVSPIISERDKTQPSFASYRANPPAWSDTWEQ